VTARGETSTSRVSDAVAAGDLADSAAVAGGDLAESETVVDLADSDSPAGWLGFADPAQASDACHDAEEPSLSPVVVRWHGDSAESPRVAESVPSGRALGAVQPREDAVKRAFNRADALVSLAQQYLRGDQPNRSPIEIVVAIPQACLRAETGAAGGRRDR
jgi:hypothetical protein